MIVYFDWGKGEDEDIFWIPANAERGEEEIKAPSMLQEKSQQKHEEDSPWSLLV